jgi:hypothetical protein
MVTNGPDGKRDSSIFSPYCRVYTGMMNGIKDVSVKKEGGELATQMTFSTRATIHELMDIIDSPHMWTSLFEGLVSMVEVTGKSYNERLVDITIVTPVIKMFWRVVCEITIREEEEGRKLVLNGRTTDLGDWPNTLFTIVVTPSTKQGRSSHVSVISRCPFDNVPLSPSSVLLIAKAIKPMIKKSINRAIASKHEESTEENSM